MYVLVCVRVYLFKSICIWLCICVVWITINENQQFLLDCCCFFFLLFFLFLFKNLIIHSYLRIDHIVNTTFECRKRDEERLIISYSVTHVKRYVSENEPCLRLHNTLHGFKGKYFDKSIQKFVKNLIVNNNNEKPSSWPMFTILASSEEMRMMAGAKTKIQVKEIKWI